ncbi:hypothetical protein J4225_04370 [Candidatus Pacearchaeota archaeon]|nr:hypothetical protein [Candidatus Pacearchaeota archaeon]
MKKKPKKQKELPTFPFPLFLDDGEIDDKRLEQRLPLELFLKHQGHEVFIDKKKYLLSISDYSEFPRDSLKLEISTWKGISPNAIHFYGQLILPSLNFQEAGTNYFCCGYGIPQVLSSVTLHRKLTEEELLESDRYHGYKRGDMVHGFNTLK